MQSELLIINAGSSSVKFSIFTATDTPQRLLVGKVDKKDGTLTFSLQDNKGVVLHEHTLAFTEGAQSLADKALELLFQWLSQQHRENHLVAVGHRVVHGADLFHQATRVDQQVITTLESLIPLAPLHQHYSIVGMKIIAERYPNLLQVACFDTAFHRTQPEVAKTYALPSSTVTQHIKHYGFHGLSYHYISSVMSNYLPSEAKKVVVAHLGNGASLCALLEGKSIATTMGFSTLNGLPMGTRCGSIDPGVLLYLLQTHHFSTDELQDFLYKQSGLLGLSQVSSDMRTLLASEEPRAKFAIDYFAYHFQLQLGTLVAALGGIDALIFTAGVGENSATIRAKCCDKLDWLQLKLSEKANHDNAVKISDPNSRVSVWVIPTNEEMIIAQQTLELYQANHS